MHYTASLREKLFFWLCIKRGFNIFCKSTKNEIIKEELFRIKKAYAAKRMQAMESAQTRLWSVCLCVCVYRAWIHCPNLIRAQTIWKDLLRSTWRKTKNIYTVYPCALVTTVHSCLLLILLLLGQWGKSTRLKMWIKRHRSTPGTVNSNSENEVFVCDVLIFPC